MNENTKLTVIEERLDKAVVGAVRFGRSSLAINTMAEAMEFAKLMSLSDKAIRQPFRGNPGMCLAVCIQAHEWGMNPYAVASKAYIVNDQIAYESQLIHAVIESRAPLKSRLNCRYEGEGPTRKCIVFGTFIGDDEPREYESPMFKDIKTKNSPLWSVDPDQQFFYYSSRGWCRRWAPDVLLGIYAPDEATLMQPERVIVEDQVSNPLGGDDEPEQGRVVSHAEGVRMITEPEPDDGAVVHADGSVTRQKPADAPKPEAAPQQPPAPENAPEATPSAGRPHPDTIVAIDKPVKWATPDYIDYLLRWTNAAVNYPVDAPYVVERWKKERRLRNALSSAFTDDEKAEAMKICNSALDALRGEPS